jgi:protein SCO1/2
MKPPSRSHRVLIGLAALGALSGAALAAPAQDDHSAHREKAKKPARYSRSLEKYTVPPVALVDREGEAVPLASALESGQPVALNFIFATCTTICPVMTATFSKMRRELGPDAEGLSMVSITIDPEYDTPKVLKEYAARYEAGPDWRFLTGELEGVVAVQRAFDAYAGNKMSHRPLTFFRGPGSGEWVRIDGLASGADLAEEYRRLLGR